jgi:hypothetical protein
MKKVILGLSLFLGAQFCFATSLPSDPSQIWDFTTQLYQYNNLYENQFWVQGCAQSNTFAKTCAKQLEYRQAQELFDNLNSDENNNLINGIFAGFNSHSTGAAIAASMNYLGVQMTAKYAFINANTSINNVAQGYETVTLSYFNGSEWVEQSFKSTRTYSYQGAPPLSGVNALLGDSEDGQSVGEIITNWIKQDDGQSFLTGLLQAQVALAPFNPVAGNPSSYMARATDETYDTANFVGYANGPVGGLSIFNMQPTYTNFSAGSVPVQVTSIPFRTAHFFNDSNALVFDMPISYIDTNGSTSYSMSLGLGWDHYFTPNWSLMPSFNAGASGSIDLASATVIYDGSLTNHYQIPFKQWTFGLTNDLSYLDTAAVSLGGYQMDYDLTNWTTKNGVDAAYQINSKYSTGAYYSRFDVLSGNTWYVPSYNEVGADFAILKKYKTSTYNFVSLGVGYLFAPQDFNGVSVNLGVNF